MYKMNVCTLLIVCILITVSSAVPNPFQIVARLCDVPPRPPLPASERITDNAEFPSVPKFPAFCVLRPSAHKIEHQVCCNCFAVAHPKFCQPDSWPNGAVNVTNVQQHFDIRRQKQEFTISGNKYTLMYQFCCDKTWLDTQAEDKAKLWTAPRLEIWSLINDPTYTFRPKTLQQMLNDRRQQGNATVDLVKNCTDFDPEACRSGQAQGACDNEEFANLCVRACGVCKPPVASKPSPPRASGPESDRATTGKCSRGEIPQNVCAKGNTGQKQLKWYFDETHQDCLAFMDKNCVEDNGVGNRFNSYRACSNQCMTSDSGSCSANRQPLTDSVTGEIKICTINRQDGTDDCPSNAKCMQGAFFSVCCDKQSELDYEESYKAVCTNGLAHVTFRDGELVRPLLGATCSKQHEFCPADSTCVKSKKFAHCCKA